MDETAAPTPVLPPEPPPITLAIEPVEPPDPASVSFGTAELGMACAPDDVERGATTLEYHCTLGERRALLRVQTAADWAAQARSGAAPDEDPVQAVLAMLNAPSASVLECTPQASAFPERALVLSARPAKLEFADGIGIRCLGAFADELEPLADGDLYFLFEGLTRDGRYHVSCALPLATDVLPPTREALPIEDQLVFAGTSEAYVSSIIERLENEAPDGFRPSLAQLDRFVGSLSIPRGSEDP